MNVRNWSSLTVAMQMNNDAELVGNILKLFFTIYGKFHERTNFPVSIWRYLSKICFKKQSSEMNVTNWSTLTVAMQMK